MTDPAEIGEHVVTGLDRMLGPVGVNDVFTDAHTIGDRLVISAAAVEKAGGFGYGAGIDADESGGGGGGGGGHLAARPVAVIEIGSGGVRVHPVFDFTRIGIAAIATLLAMTRPRRKRG